MRRVAGQKDPAAAITIGEQEIQLPLADVQHVEPDRDAHRALELRGHVFGALDRRVQRPVLRRVLHDEKRRLTVRDVVMTSAPGTVADRNPIVQLRTEIQSLIEAREISFSPQRNPELLADGAGASVAPDEEPRPDLARLACRIGHPRHHRVGLFAQREEFTAVPERHRGESLRFRLEQRLNRVLRDELIWLARHRAVVARRDLRLGLGHRRVRQPQQRRFVHRHRDVDVHRDLAVEPRGAHLRRDPHPPEDLHRPRVAAFHLGEELGRGFPLDQHGADAAAAEIDRKRQPHWTRSDDENVRVHVQQSPNRRRAAPPSAARRTGARLAGTSTPTRARR